MFKPLGEQRFVHDCDKCVFLGCHLDDDLWFCPRDEDIILRTSDREDAYRAMPIHLVRTACLTPRGGAAASYASALELADRWLASDYEDAHSPRPFRVTEQTPGRTCTIMNRGGHFVVIREPTSDRWRRDQEALADRGPSLCSLQMRHAAMGQVTVELMETLHGYWSIRNLSNLGETWPAGRVTNLWSRQEAIDAAIKWWEEKPSHREIVLRGSAADGLGV